MRININIYLAAEAVMYLPVYVAHEKGIFTTLLKNATIQLIPASGDYDAIKKMCDDNERTPTEEEDTFAIAIADPNSIKDAENARIIGALIDRLSFWGVSPSDIDFHLVKISKKGYTRLVYYDENLITGHMLGKKVQKIESISNIQTVTTLGDEFQHLKTNTLIITSDLLEVAKHCVSKQAYVNLHFAKRNRYISNTYLTTAIITSNFCIEKNSKVSELIRIIEAIQKAKSIIYSSKQIAKEILLNLDCIKNIKTNQEAVADFIIKTITDDRIYPSDMNISEEQWKNTQPPEAGQGIDFSVYVNNDIVLKTEKIIANQFGITFHETFSDEYQRLTAEIDSLTERLTNLEGKRSRIRRCLKKIYSNPWLFWTIVPAVLYTLVYLCSYLLDHRWTRHKAASGALLCYAVPMVTWAWQQHVTRKKRNTKIVGDTR